MQHSLAAATLHVKEISLLHLLGQTKQSRGLETGSLADDPARVVRTLNAVWVAVKLSVEPALQILHEPCPLETEHLNHVEVEAQRNYPFFVGEQGWWLSS